VGSVGRIGHKGGEVGIREEWNRKWRDRGLERKEREGWKMEAPKGNETGERENI
jgi:hypothetical protein